MPHRLQQSSPVLAGALALGLAFTGSVAAADRDTLPEEVSENFIHGQLWATYATNPSLSAANIDVDVNADTVTLDGVVETFGQKALAAVIAREVEGVERVVNNLRVDPELVVVTVTPSRTFADAVSDATLAANVDAMLLMNQYTDGLDITVAADDGTVTLDGVADTSGARQRATEVALDVAGVDTVVNRMRVDANAVAESTDTPVSDDWIEDTLEHVYLFSGTVNSGMLQASVDDGEVTLQGIVDSPLERQMAIELAQDIRGVDRVDANQLRVR